ncbi:MAG TPA: zf-TFIIB domain-containing protein, partial [Pyrinomonadaceae bacterium]|nr:zf-TFIIB domain-containing protein [Pyrinomonadaceae bacterium]
SFNDICASSEQQSAVLGAASPAPSNELKNDESRVRYVPCPECGQLMNRINFARCSGVIVDVCKGHGTWFDRDELRQIVEFIRAGGLDASRARELAKIEEERRQLQQEQLSSSMNQNSLGGGLDAYSRAGALHAARGLLKFL